MVCERAQVMMQACQGIDGLHSRSIVHCDIACRNLLIDSPSLGVYECYITDFGLSRTLNDEHTQFTFKSVLPVAICAPELMPKDRCPPELEQRKPVFSPASDVW